MNANKAIINKGYDAFFTHVLAGGGIAHEVERSLAVVRSLGGVVTNSRLEAWISDRDKAVAKEKMGRMVGRRIMTIALGPGASEPAKRWPIERFVMLAQILHQEMAAAIVVVGGAEERTLGDAIARACAGAVADLTGSTTLSEAAAVLGQCDAFIGNNSGPAHLAAAAGIPVVVISCHPQDGEPDASRSPERFGPWLVDCEILRPHRATPPCVGDCRAACAHCILDVVVDDVVAGLRRLLRKLASTASVHNAPI